LYREPLRENFILAPTTFLSHTVPHFR